MINVNVFKVITSKSITVPTQNMTLLMKNIYTAVGPVAQSV